MRLSILFIVSLLLGCSSTPTPTNSAQTISAHDSPSKVLESLQRDLQKAQQQSVGLLSPQHFAQASELTAEAKELFNRGVTLDELYTKIGEARAKLQMANDTAKVSQSQLKETLLKRQETQKLLSEATQASVIGLPELKQSFVEADQELQNLTRGVENGKTEWARNEQSNVLNLYEEIATKTNQKSYADEAERIVQQAIHEGAEKHLPKTLNQVQTRVTQIKNWITQPANQKKKAEMEKQRGIALFQARRLLQLTRAAGNFAKKDTEEIVLWVETRLQSMESLLATDLRDRPFDEQFSEIRKTLESKSTPPRTLATKPPRSRMK